MASIGRGRSSRPGERSRAADDPAAEARIPSITDFLALLSWGPEDPRTTGTLLLVAEEGTWKCWVNDRDGKRQAWVSCDTLLGLLQLLEDGLASDRLPWRAAQPRKGR